MGMYRIYQTVKEGSPKGLAIERSLGCDGKRHVESIGKIRLNRKGGSEYQEEIDNREMGLCDRTCGPEDLGDIISPHFFLGSSAPTKPRRLPSWHVRPVRSLSQLWEVSEIFPA